MAGDADRRVEVGRWPAAERRHDVAHQGGYGDDALAAWAGLVRSWRRRGISVYCYFDNGERGYALLNALTQKRLVARADAKGSHKAAAA